MDRQEAPGPEAPCRLFVFLAREAPIGVVLRRGPSDWVQLNVWHTDSDAVERGQWMKCRVYERRSDLSADGALFAYFARGAPRASTETSADSWVAISRPPYFTALALWFVGGTYYTGPFFPDRASLWNGFRDDSPDQGRLPSWLSIRAGLPPYVDGTSDWPERTVYVNRLMRDGWERVEDAPRESWQRHSAGGELTLIMTEVIAWDPTVYGGPHVVEYAVRSEADGETAPLGRATWADFDQRGRLVIAQDGRLLHWQASGTMDVIADLNVGVPDPSPAPASARAWPKRPPGRRRPHRPAAPR